MSFDYGVDEDLLTSHIGNNIKQWPTEGKFTLLLDADHIPYIVGYTSDDVQYLAAKRDPAGFQESQMFKDKCDHANYILNHWVKQAGADSVILYVTGDTNFRFGILPSYKAQRDEESKPKPPFFYEIKQWLIDYHGALVSEECEADDAISIEAWDRLRREEAELWSNSHKVWSNYIIGSKDKDLNMIPGWHVNDVTGEKYWVQGVGSLDPIWKVREVTNYEYHPLFNGKTVDYRNCSTIIMRGDIKILDHEETHSQLPDPLSFGDKWPMEFVWYTRLNGKCQPVEQDTYSRGKNKGVGKFKRVKAGMRNSEYIDKLKGTGLSFFYAQLLMGDPVDNYFGLEGYGETKAYELLRDCTTELELYQTVRREYQAVHGDKADEALLTQGRCAWMQTEVGELWNPPGVSRDQSYPL